MTSSFFTKYLNYNFLIIIPSVWAVSGVYPCRRGDPAGGHQFCQQMKVLKFGGTSVGSINSILSVKRIVEAIEEPVIVVVSALGGITDKLLATSNLAAKGNLAYEKELSEIIARHLDVIEGVIERKETRMEVQKKAMELLDELGNIFKGVYLINDLSAKTSDTIVSYGERLSSLIISNVIEGARFYDSRKFIKTVKQFNKHNVDFELTNRLIQETFSPLPKVALVPGFISSSKETGEVTNLGRGGSDYTASILAAALDASSLEIWTDVDDRPALLHRGDGAMQLRGESDLSPYDLPSLP